MCAVKQAIGRAIRNKDDYGIFYLCDGRYTDPNLVEHIPRWMKKTIYYGSVEQLKSKGSEFLKNNIKRRRDDFQQFSTPPLQRILETPPREISDSVRPNLAAVSRNLTFDESNKDK